MAQELDHKISKLMSKKTTDNLAHNQLTHIECMMMFSTRYQTRISVTFFNTIPHSENGSICASHQPQYLFDPKACRNRHPRT